MANYILNFTILYILLLLLIGLYNPLILYPNFIIYINLKLILLTWNPNSLIYIILILTLLTWNPNPILLILFY